MGKEIEKKNEEKNETSNMQYIYENNSWENWTNVFLNKKILSDLSNIGSREMTLLNIYIKRNEAASSRKYKESIINSKRNDFLSDENIVLKNKLIVLEQENKIFVPKPSQNDVNKKEFEALSHIIYEINVTYDHEAYTALILLSRKAIVNLGFVLLSEFHKQEMEDGKIEIIKGDWKDFIKNNDHDFVFIEISDLKFSTWLNWMYKERYLTKKNLILINNMKNKSNEINHQMEFSNSKEEAKKFYLSIKEMIESNFDSKNIGDFSNGKNSELTSISWDENEFYSLKNTFLNIIKEMKISKEKELKKDK